MTEWAIDFHTAVSVFTVTGVVVAAILSYLNHHAIQEVHLTMNSRLDSLIEMTKRASFAEGQAAQTVEAAKAAAQVLNDAAKRASTTKDTP